jgi:dimethylaniline monooxygenase (N-oxide forming)
MAASDSRFFSPRAPRAGATPERGAEVSPGAGSTHLHTLRRPERPSVCVIGAGCSGLTAIKALTDAGLPVEAFESGDRVGGNWVFGNTNGQSNIYRSLHINTSRERMQFRDFPMPAGTPDYPRHDVVARYFESYADAFGLKSKIRFRTRVTHAAPHPAGGYEVTLSTGESKRYDALVVANGHHWDPRFPEPRFPGTFDGVELHSHDYVSPSEPHDLRGKRVLVIGFGNSAVDIACELGHPGVAERVFISVRRGAWVLPKYAFGKPIDQTGAVPSILPLRLKQALAGAMFKRLLGSMSSYGLPEPDHPIGGAHPTISSDFLTRVGSGDVIPKPVVSELLGNEVRFADGTREPVDAIVYATGYKVTFPFFDAEFVSAPDNHLPLYFRLFHLEHPRLFFIGLAQPLGAIMPIAEAQSKLVAEHLTGRYALPPPGEMRAHTEAWDARMKKRYVASPRHTMQIDYDEYLELLERERRRGQKRAERG